MVNIEHLGIESICPIIAFDQLCFPTDFWNETDWKMLLEDDRAIYYAILDGKAIVGNIFIYNWQGERDYIKIMNIAVHPNWRKRGLAHQLLNHVTQHMKELGMFQFCGETRASNLAMQKVFTDCGYRLNTVEEGYYDRPAESAYKYVLQL